ncbi:MAG: lysoplasmalogenase, partial [Actinomycetota bacterium]|nr:lysoplasmalogenase [Actinomycetota bacterium]
LAYSAALGGMAVVALDTGQTRASVGGSLFMLSDTLLALKRFGGLSFPLQEAAVMATYTTAQYLLAGD